MQHVHLYFRIHFRLFHLIQSDTFSFSKSCSQSISIHREKQVRRLKRTKFSDIFSPENMIDFLNRFLCVKKRRRKQWRRVLIVMPAHYVFILKNETCSFKICFNFHFLWCFSFTFTTFSLNRVEMVDGKFVHEEKVRERESEMYRRKKSG